MHSLGVLALNEAIGPDYQRLFASAASNYTDLLRIEARELGYDHAELGGMLAEKWNLPPQLTAALRWFPRPESADPSVYDLVSCVAAGSAASDVFLSETPGPALNRFRQRCLDRFGLGASDFNTLLDQIQADAEAMRNLFDLTAGRAVNIGEVLAEANEALELLSFEAERENVQLDREKTQLFVEASTDALTGLASRRRLMEFLESAVGAALRRDTPLVYLMLDIDHFKRVNDTFGHPVGDEVLRQVGLTIGQTTRDGDMAGRYGGEEFAVVAPETNLQGVVLLAQRLRTLIEDLEIRTSPETTIKVTVSIGVSYLDPEWENPVAELIAAADGALYEAKEAGRNVVRIARAGAAAA